jgi:hypothetical protein
MFSGERKSGPVSRPRAWVLAGINLLAFPGLGTLLAGRRAGYFQAAIMLAGFALATGYGVWFILSAVRVLADPVGKEADWQAAVRPHAWIAAVGLGLCVGAWLWSLVSSVQILRAAGPPPYRGPAPPRLRDIS